MQGSSLGSPLPSRTEISAIRYHFHTKISRERKLTFDAGAAAVYSQQHTMHRRWAVSSGEEKHEVCRLITPSILIRGHSFLQGSSLRSPFPSRTKICPIRYHFHYNKWILNCKILVFWLIQKYVHNIYLDKNFDPNSSIQE